MSGELRLSSIPGESISQYISDVLASQAGELIFDISVNNTSKIFIRLALGRIVLGFGFVGR
jgi:hypothetical protein